MQHWQCDMGHGHSVMWDAGHGGEIWVWVVGYRMQTQT